MSPDRIGRSSSMSSWIHEVAGKTGQPAKAGKRPPVKAETQAADANGARALRADLAALVEGVDLESADAVRSLRRPAIRRILLNEFGGDFGGHPDLGAMVERIDAVMDVDQAAFAQFLRMLKDLKGS